MIIHQFKYKRILFILLIMFLFFGCNGDDNDSPIIDPCEEAYYVDEIYISDVSLQPVDSESQRGYIINATFTNNSDVRIDGEVTIVIYKFNKNYSTIISRATCNTLQANSSCDFEYYNSVQDEELFDPNAIIKCIYFNVEN